MAQRSVAPELPGFTYIDWIGGGGFADVFRYQDALGRRVAVKVTHGASGESAQAFEAEANLMAKLSNHPNIVSIYLAGVAPDGRTYLVMEECATAHLGARISKRLLTVSKAMEITIQLAGAIETAHRLGILHRDIKPANILFTEFQRPALTDFGISVSGDGALASNALSPLWAPPEQHPDSGVPMGPWSDVFSLAATTWAMLVGRSPLEVPGGDNDRLSLRHRARTFSPPATGRPDVAEVLERVLRTAMAPNPDQRYRTALEFARALQGVQGQLNESVTSIDVLAEEADDDDVEPEQQDTGTRISGFMLIDPYQVDDPSVTANVTDPPTGGVTTPHDNTFPGPRDTPAPSVRQHGRGFAAPGLRDFTGPAVPAVAPGAQAPAPPPTQQPAPMEGKRRNRAAAVLIPVLGLIAVGGVVAALWLGGVFSGAASGPASSQPAATQAAQDPLSLRVPPVEDLTGAAEGVEVTFQWVNPDPQTGDKYVVEEISRSDDIPLEVVEEQTITVEAQPGQTCIEVSLRRSNGQVSSPVKECVTP